MRLAWVKEKQVQGKQTEMLLAWVMERVRLLAWGKVKPQQGRGKERRRGQGRVRQHLRVASRRGSSSSSSRQQRYACMSQLGLAQA
jgi:hypothetical protein